MLVWPEVLAAAVGGLAAVVQGNNPHQALAVSATLVVLVRIKVILHASQVVAAAVLALLPTVPLMVRLKMAALVKKAQSLARLSFTLVAVLVEAHMVPA
jgi:hypothetical protein